MPSKTPRPLRLATLLLGAFGSGAALLHAGAHAQAAAAPPVQQLDRVEVTGSNIRRVQAETASPVQTLSRDDIDKSGKTSVAELLQTLAVDNQGSVPASFTGGFAAGGTAISLRGLGAASTLVLVNGRRIAPYGLADDGRKLFADLSVIPLDAVERVEILKDGASAIYGSDAVAGVVNIILRRDFNGTTLRASYGQSRYGDGSNTLASLTTGFGSLADDRYNVLFNLELNRKGAIDNRDRAGRGAIGRLDLRDLGFDASSNGGNGTLGGTGAIIPGTGAVPSINGNVRNPATAADSQDYYSRGNPNGVGFTRTFPGAACENLTAHPQGDPGGGCLTDPTQEFGQLTPRQRSVNLFGRGTLQIAPDLQAYGELTYFNSRNDSISTPASVSSSVGFPGGAVVNSGVVLGASHPDNPYFGSAARLRYAAYDVGPRRNEIDSTFTRFVGGVKGSWKDWDYDSAVLLSRSRTSNTYIGFLQRDVAFALLNPDDAANVASAQAHSAAYAGLPPGTFWRIAENAGLNSPALYAALSPNIANHAVSSTDQIDFKASRELGQLGGGALGLALGIEYRRESVRLDPVDTTERGNVIGLGYSAYDGSRNVGAVYAELLAPVTKTLELSGALRLDHYSDVGNSLTPKFGAKWLALPQFALRATYAEGFRAPSAAENGKGGLAAFSNGVDQQRCDLGVPGACGTTAFATITSPNPNLEPEKSRNYSVGFVWEPLPKSSVSVDLWQIVRKNEINQEQTTAAIAAGRVVRDPDGKSNIPGDPGPLVAVLANYQNSARTTVRGLDLDARQGFGLGDWGRLTMTAQWTHLFRWLREEGNGTSFEFVGTHGNCDVTNCAGTPADRVNLGASWDRGPWRLAAVLNYRASIENKAFKDDPSGCGTLFADGSDAPAGCRIASFTTVDLTGRWQPNDRVEIFGTIQNLFDRVAPFDPYTYGAVGWNPYDYSGALGRFFSVGLKVHF